MRVYLPKFTINKPNVGEYTIHGWLAKMGFASALAVGFREGRYLIIIKHQGIQIYIWQRIKELPSLKLTFSHLKISGWKMKFPFGMNYFWGYVKLPGSTAVFFSYSTLLQKNCVAILLIFVAKEFPRWPSKINMICFFHYLFCWNILRRLTDDGNEPFLDGEEICFIFTPIWGRFPIWLIFFKWVETTNQL